MNFSEPAASHASTPLAVYRTKPAALVVKRNAVYRLNWMLKMFEAGVIEKSTLGRFVEDQIQAGSILQPCWESVRVELTGRRYGHLVEYTMAGFDGEYWSVEDDIISS